MFEYPGFIKYTINKLDSIKFNSSNGIFFQDNAKDNMEQQNIEEKL